MKDYTKLIYDLRNSHDLRYAKEHCELERDAADALEAAEKRIAELEKQHGNPLTINIMLTAKIPKKVADAKTVDAVPVVRCKDCKWWNTDGYRGGYGECPNVFCETTADYFCADGEKK